MELEFIPLDYNYFEHEDKNYARVIGRDSQEKRICLIDSCDIYFWAILKLGEDKKYKKIQKDIEKIKDVLKTELHDKNFMGEKVKAIKVFVTRQRDISYVVEKLPHRYIEHIRENDLPYITRYIIERKLVPLRWHKISGKEIENKEKLKIDSCIRVEKIDELEKEKLFNPKVLAFDIETNEFEIGKGEILMISIVGENFKKVLTWKHCKKSSKEVECFSSEKTMLESFVRYIKELSPDILVGYFSDGFDLPYLKARAQKLGFNLSVGLDGSSVKFTGGMRPRGKIFGIVHVDLLQFIQSAYSQYLQAETLSLNEVAGELLGEKKTEHEFKHTSKMSEDDWKRFFDYNLQDSVLTYKLFVKTWDDMIEFARIMQEPLFDVSRNGMAANVEDYIVHNLDKYNEIIEKKPSHDEISKRRERERYEGAFVLQPVPKLYENIVMFDFTSYWPSIIATFNFSASTFLKDKKTEDARAVNIGKKKLYFSKKKGFFPGMLEEVIKKRKLYKEEFKKNPSPILKARSNAFKLLANASYGYQGFFGARYYCPEASAATTAVSRKYIKSVIEKAKEGGFNAIYSDTDSIVLELGKKTKSQALNFLKKINSKLPGIMELELEDFYKRGIWVTTRKGEIGAKKKYALINEHEKLKIRGFETVRRDWCGLARELQNEILEMILKQGNEKNALDYLKKIIKQLKNREVDKKKLIIRTQLKKPLSEYKAITPHVTIARKMLEKQMPVDAGMLIEYYMAETKNEKALARDKAVFPDDKKPYDIKYYLTKQILPAVENIFAVFNIDIKEIIEGNSQKTLF